MNVELLDGGRQLAKLLCAYSMAAPAREVLRCPSRGLARLQLLRIGVLWRAGHMKKEYCHIRLWRAGHVSPQPEKATVAAVGAVAAIRSQADGGQAARVPPVCHQFAARARNEKLSEINVPA